MPQCHQVTCPDFPAALVWPRSIAASSKYLWCRHRTYKTLCHCLDRRLPCTRLVSACCGIGSARGCTTSHRTSARAWRKAVAVAFSVRYRGSCDGEAFDGWDISAYWKCPGDSDTARRGSRKGWLRGQDLNLRPSGYEPDELPDCSTPRLEEQDYSVFTDCMQIEAVRSLYAGLGNN